MVQVQSDCGGGWPCTQEADFQIALGITHGRQMLEPHTLGVICLALHCERVGGGEEAGLHEQQMKSKEGEESGWIIGMTLYGPLMMAPAQPDHSLPTA